MPIGIMNTHAYDCHLCGWRKEADKRTLRHAVNLHAKLSHGIKHIHLELHHKQKLGKSEFRNQTAIPPEVAITETSIALFSK